MKRFTFINMYSIYSRPRPRRNGCSAWTTASRPDWNRNYSIRIIRNEQQISDNNATPGNAGYLPTVDLSSGFSGTLNNNNNKLSDGTTEKTNGIHNETADIGLNVNWTVFDGLGIQATYEKLKEFRTWEN